MLLPRAYDYVWLVLVPGPSVEAAESLKFWPKYGCPKLPLDSALARIESSAPGYGPG